MIGALHASGLDLSLGLRQKRKLVDLTGASQSEATNALESIHGHSEFCDRKRSLPASFRLHPAKFLTMDKMLKQMFFPMMTTKLNFGMSSFSGLNLQNVDDRLADVGAGRAATSIEQAMRPRGLFRGVMQFCVRDTNFAVNRNSQNALNPSQFAVGGYIDDFGSGGTSTEIISSYRRFTSQPSSGADGATQGGTGPPAIVDGLQAANNTVRSLSMGSNLNDIEQNAVAGMVYADPIISKYRVTEDTEYGAQVTPAANTGLIGGEDTAPGSTIIGPSAGNYWSYVKDGIVRIADGYVHIDIMNTEQTPCVVELVIHSRKKSELTTQDVYNMLWNDVNRSQKQKAVTDAASTSANGAGGWQAWWDPKYPLLKFNSKARVKDYISEVHRSNHVLAPGQSKMIKISLGSLWYKIGGKSDQPYTATGGSSPSYIDKVKTNAGQLYFNIGHSGFEYPQNVAALPNAAGTFTSPSTNATATQPYGNLAGTGFWVGKATAPSSISIDGTYCDKFYPATFDRSSNGVLNHDILKVASCDHGAVPLATIVPARIATTQADIVQPLAPDV